MSKLIENGNFRHSKATKQPGKTLLSACSYFAEPHPPPNDRMSCTLAVRR